MNNQYGAIIFGHGSRDPLWYVPMQRVADDLKKLNPDWHISLAFLEMNPLSLEVACHNLASLGVTHLSITPLFFGVGKHVREDLPLLVDQLKNQHPHMTIELLAAVGEHPAFSMWVAQLISQSSLTPTASS